MFEVANVVAGESLCRVRAFIRALGQPLQAIRRSARGVEPAAAAG